MDKLYISTQAEQLLQADKPKEAIDLLLDFLERSNDDSPQLYKELIQLKARWLRAKRQRGMGIITAKREAEINSDLELDIRTFLDWLNGRSPIRRRTWWLKIPNYAYVLMVVGVVLLTGLTWYVTQNQFTQKANAHCPTFDEMAEFNILLLPYTSSNTKIEIAERLEIQQHLDLYIDSMNLAIDAAWSDLLPDEDRYPASFEEANAVANACGADMIIWAKEGQLQGQLNQENTAFQFYELFPGMGEEMLERKVEIPIEVAFSLEIKELPSTLNFLLGTAANQIQDYSSAAQLMRTPLQDSSNLSVILLKYLQLAHSETQVNNYIKAVEAYDLLLRSYPNSKVFKMNRAVLAMQYGRFEQSLTDLDALISRDSQHVHALYAKGRTFAKMMQFKEAEFYLKQLDTLLTIDSTAENVAFKTDILDKTLSDIAKKTYEAQKSLRLNRQTLREDENISGLRNEILQLMIQLGEDDKALEWIESVPTFNNNTLLAIENRLLALKVTGQEELLQRWKTWLSSNSKLLEAKVIQVAL